MIEKRSYFFLPYYYYYCFRRIFSIGTYIIRICTAAYGCIIIIIRTVFALLLLLLLYTFGYYIAVPTTVLPIPRNLLLLFFNTNRDFSFKVVKIYWWPRQSCER